ncbi:MAG: IPT/TIG domain-containing protein [Acidobacteria bacterium]|nr:IPT/TIG domain-containing protein [Acidobacteriota bacterium]
MTITGTGFWHSASVAFGGVAASTVTCVSSTELRAVAPAHAAGAVSVSVTQGWHKQSAILTGGFTYIAASSASTGISGVSPSQGPTSGGTVVTVKGTGFQTGAAVAFGGVHSTAVTVTSSTQINAVSPPESSGTVAVTVTDPNAQPASLPSAFTYTSGPSVSSVSPTSGPVTGGTAVTILGSGFQSGASVAFGGVTATSVNVVSSTEIQAVTPSSPAGTISIAVANPNSQTGTLASAFTFYHTVSLSWTASTSTVSGYNVYRSSTSGGPYTKLNSSSVPGTAYTDNNAQAGQTYFYVTTAVNSSNQESAYSNQSQTTVPSP